MSLRKQVILYYVIVFGAIPLWSVAWKVSQAIGR